MGRTIEFRGKAKDDGIWVYGDLTTGDTIHNSPSWYEDGEGEWWGHECYEETIGQFTGLKDKNGVKIYEGDIVVCLHAGQSIRGAIINKDACYFIKFTNGQMAWIGEAVKKYKVEVLGNIHDNHELIEKNQEK